MKDKLTISKNIRAFEIIAVLITAAAKFLFMDLFNLRLPFIIITIAFWGAYVIFRSAKNKGILSYWGFRLDNFREVTRLVIPFTLLAVITFFIVGSINGTLNFTWRILPVLLLYPIWGMVQQFLVIALVAGNLDELKTPFPKSIIILFTAMLFGLLHYPHWWLVAGTFVLALFYGFVYFKCRNIFVLGIVHGWLGAIFFYTVVARDPFHEVFGRYL